MLVLLFIGAFRTLIFSFLVIRERSKRALVLLLLYIGAFRTQIFFFLFIK